MKKILIIHDSMGGGGAERVLVTLLNALDPYQYDITLLLIYKEGPFFSDLPGHIKVKWLFEAYSSITTRAITHFYRFRNYIREKLARRILGHDKFDVAVSFMEGAPAKLHSQLLDYAPKNLSWVHSNQAKDRWYDFWFKLSEEKEFYKRIDKIAFVSKVLKNCFENTYSTEAEKYVIYNPIDENFISSQYAWQDCPKSDIFTIVNSGRLIPQKNQALLIDVAEILKRHKRRFCIKILGQGPLYEKLRTSILAKKLENEIELVGFVNNPFPIVGNADVFCLTSVSEGWGMVVAEAMSLSVPTVSTPVPAVEEILEGGGGIVTNGSAEKIASAIEFLMDNPQQRISLGLAAKNSVSRFDIHNVITSVKDFMDCV